MNHYYFDDSHKLANICIDLVEIERQLMEGEISFYYDNLMCALKPGHPAELLDEVLTYAYMTSVIQGRDVPLDSVKQLAADVQGLKEDFRIKELAAPLKRLKDYIKEQEESAE